ncbi:2-C-methyl-D-erythritol 4-phosphate cytidylyltransferase [Saccharicrinis sp. FJH54]|uniref:2-C-methyl-D-erythritol 4-phosphate cytidylyltransferase n=1 Tax=Saccharicrinis sp. FJH54 TaxID=3344665 RepID=UPI0035D3FD43
MKNHVIIVAGGSGKRMQSSVPKQFMVLHGKPVLMHTIDQFLKFDPDITVILVLPENQIDYWHSLCTTYKYTANVKITNGGPVRFESVRNGLNLITEDGIVGIHDGVRPFVSLDTIKHAYQKAANVGAVIPIRDMEESLRFSDQNTNYAVNRDHLKVVQTPQVFKTKIIKEAYSKPYIPEFTDDASVVERAGYKIYLIEGNRENIKLTTPFDFIIGNALLKSQE